MHHYGLSEQKVLGVIRRPKRIETGIAPDTVAVMQVAGTIKKGPVKSKWGKSSFGQGYEERAVIDDKEKESWSQEIWVLYQIKNIKFQNPNSKQIPNIKNPKLKKIQDAINSNKKITIISAWRYPGVSPEKDPIPAEIWREIEEAGIIK